LIRFSAPTKLVHHYSNRPGILRRGFSSDRSPPTRLNQRWRSGRDVEEGRAERRMGMNWNGHGKKKRRGREILLALFWTLVSFSFGSLDGDLTDRTREHRGRQYSAQARNRNCVILLMR
jgi:hypothetical protein